MSNPSHIRNVLIFINPCLVSKIVLGHYSSRNLWIVTSNSDTKDVGRCSNNCLKELGKSGHHVGKESIIKILNRVLQQLYKNKSIKI